MTDDPFAGRLARPSIPPAEGSLALVIQRGRRRRRRGLAAVAAGTAIPAAVVVGLLSGAPAARDGLTILNTPTATSTLSASTGPSPSPLTAATGEPAEPSASAGPQAPPQPGGRSTPGAPAAEPRPTPSRRAWTDGHSTEVLTAVCAGGVSSQPRYRVFCGSEGPTATTVQRGGTVSFVQQLCRGADTTPDSTYDLRFRGGQEQDGFVTRKGSEQEVWRWSADKAFRGGPHTVSFANQQCHTWRLDWVADVAPGTYVLTGYLLDADDPGFDGHSLDGYEVTVTG